MKLLFDTSTLIGLLEQGPRNETLVSMAKGMAPDIEHLYSAVTFLELCIGEHSSAATAAKLLAAMRSVPLDDEVARRAGRLLTISFGKKRRQIPDAIIAASALKEDAWLWTLNEKDFKGILGLRMFSLQLPEQLRP